MSGNNYGVMTPLDTELARLLDDRRSHAGIRMQTLAEHLGWAYVTVNNKLRGTRAMYVHDLVEIAAAIGVDPAELLRESVQAAGASIGPVPDSQRRRCEICGNPIAGDAHARQIYCEGRCTQDGKRAKGREHDRRRRAARRAG
jgi:transcriptional regulator with XRE-family HTH domain